MLVESSRKAFSFLFQWVNWSTKWEYHLSMGFSICNSSSKCGCSCGFMGDFYREQLNLWVLLRDNFFSPKKSAWRPRMSLAHPLLTRTKRRALQTPTEPFFFRFRSLHFDQDNKHVTRTNCFWLIQHPSPVRLHISRIPS